MDPNPAINEMYAFLAFDEALGDGLNVGSLIEQQAAQGRAHLESRIEQLTLHLDELIDVNEQDREQLIEDARGLGPNDARVYCNLLTERVHDLKQSEAKQKQAFDTVEKVTREQCAQNAQIIDSIAKMRSLSQKQRNNQSHLQRELYAAGNSLCQYIARPQ